MIYCLALHGKKFNAQCAKIILISLKKVNWVRLNYATTHHCPTPSTTAHHHPLPSTYTHHRPPPLTNNQNISTTTHHNPKYIHHHPPQSKIYPSKVFYKKNINFFYSEVRNLTSRSAIAKKLFFFIWPSLLNLLRTQEMVSVNNLYYAKLVYF